VLVATFFLTQGHVLLGWFPFTGRDGHEILLPIIIAAYSSWFLLQLVSICWWEANGGGTWATICELCKPIPPGQSISRVIRANRAAPPRIVLSATGWDHESREVIDEEEPYRVEITRDIPSEAGKGGGGIRTAHIGWETHWRRCRTHGSEWARQSRGGGRFASSPPLSAPDHRLGPARTETPENTTFLKQLEFPCASWEEQGPVVDLTVALLLTVRFPLRYEFDEETQAILTRLRSDLMQEAAAQSEHYSVDQAMTTPGFVDQVFGSIDEEACNRIRRLAGGCGYAVWVVCWIFGFQAIFECYARHTKAEVSVPCVKRISAFRNLRASPGATDDAAADLIIPQRTSRTWEELRGAPGSFRSSGAQELLSVPDEAHLPLAMATLYT
jgi:hypothetical protein